MGFVVFAVFIIGALGYAAQHSVRTAAPAKHPNKFSSSHKADYIYNYASASTSLQTTLVNQYYEQAKKDCISQNELLSGDDQFSDVLYVSKVVRDTFATVQFCGSDAEAIFAHIDNNWKLIDRSADFPACSLVDQYKISKDIIDKCYQDQSDELADVTNP